MKAGDKVLTWYCKSQNYSAPAFGGATRDIKKVEVLSQHIITLTKTEDVEGDTFWIGTLPDGEEYTLLGMRWARTHDRPRLPDSLEMTHVILQTHKPSDGWQIIVEHQRLPVVPFALSDFAMLGHCTLHCHDRYYAKAWGCINCKLAASAAAQAKSK